MNATYEWALYGLVIQVVLFHCASSVAKDLTNAARTREKLKRHLTTNHSHINSEGDEYFKRLLESQNKQSKTFVSSVQSVKRPRKQVI
jgi:hypothetical protein